MAYNAITTTEIQTGKPSKQSLWQKVKDNFDYLFGLSSGASGIRNGSFEIDSDSDGIPDGWTRYLYPGGSSGFETTNPEHGAKGYYFVHPGGASNGGGYLESDYAEVSELETLFLRWTMKSSVLGIKNIVTVRYFDKSKVYLSSVDLYNATANITTARKYYSEFTPPASARYIKVRLTGGYTDTNAAGTVLFDDVEFGEASRDDEGLAQAMGTHFLGISNMPQNATVYFTNLGTTGTLGEGNVQYYPHSPVTIRDLFVSANAAPPAGQTFTITLRKNGVDTALTATITNTATKVSNLASSVDFGPQDLISWKCVSSATTGSTIDIVISYRHLQYGTGYGESLIPFNQTNYGGSPALIGLVNNRGTYAVGNTRIPLARAAVVSRLHIIYDAAVSEANYASGQLYFDGAARGAYAPLNHSNIRLIPGALAGASQDVMLGGSYDSLNVVSLASIGSWGLGRYRETDETIGLLLFGSLNQPQNSTYYMTYPGVVGTVNETDIQVPVKAGTLKNLALRNLGTGIAGQTWTATVRKNGVDTGLTVTLSGTTTIGSDTANTVTFADGDLLSIKLVASATTGTRTLTASVEHVA